MAPYAQDSTVRMRVTYRAGGREHKFFVRPPDNTVGTLNAVASGIDYLLAVLRPNMFSDFAPLSVAVAAKNEALFLPFAYTFTNFAAATASTTDPAPRDSVKFVSWQGVSTMGARWSLTLFGPIVIEGGLGNGAYQDYRLQPSEGTIFTSVVLGELADLLAELVAIDGMGIVPHPYANIGYSAYYQRKSRKGA